MLRNEVLSNKETQMKLTELNHELLRMSNLDELTGQYNRRAFDAIASKIIKQARLSKSNIHIYLFDIDRFKQFNDTHGHMTGDNVLIEISHHIKAQFKGDKQVFARFGGEEFIAIDIGLTDEEALNKAEHIRQSVSTIHLICPDNTVTHMTISIGLASYLKPHPLFDMIHTADTALYQAKSNGRDKVVQLNMNSYYKGTS